MLSKKLEPGYPICARLSFLLCSVLDKQSTESTAAEKSSSQVIHSLPMSLVFAQFCSRKAATRHALRVKFKPIVLITKHLRGFLPSTHTSAPMLSTFSGSQLAFCPWRSKIHSSKHTLGREVIFPCETRELLTGAYCVIPTHNAHSLTLSPSP